MDRINKIGRTLIGYKSEYSKHYSPIVDESLMIALETQLEKRLLDQEIFDMIINDSISLNDFEAFIGNKREYAKSQKELLEEFEKIRAIVNEALTNINFIEFIETESNTEINKISILKQYTISEEFIKMYFGLEDVDMAQIMKKKGFAEKFAVLRLTKVFKEIFSEMRAEAEFTQGFSRVYYNPDVNGFSIDYKYHLPVDFINKENIDAKVKKVRDVDRVVERKFAKKIGLNLYNVNEKQQKQSDLNVSKKAPNNKFTEQTINEEELNKIKNEVKQESKVIEEVKVETKVEVVTPPSNNEKKEKNNNQNQPNQNNKNNNKNKQNNQNKQEDKKPQEKKQEPKKVTEDYLDKDLDDSVSKDSDVLEIVENISSMVIEEDYSGDFDASNFEGLLPDDENILIPEMDFPDDLDDIDELGDIDLSNIPPSFDADDVDDDV